MNQDIVSRAKAGSFLIFIFIILCVATLTVFAYSFGCSFGYQLECTLVPRVVSIFLYIHIPIVLSAFAVFIRPFLSNTTFRVGVFAYILFLIASVFAIILVKENGLVNNSLLGTERACQLMGQYSVERQYCYESLAQRTDNIGYCDQAQTINCYLHFAEKNNDPSLCPITDTYCILTMAEKLSDSSLCQKISNKDMVSQCYASIAEKNKDELLCAYSDQSFSYCNDVYLRMAENPNKYVTATKIDLTFEIIHPSIKSGQNDVELMKVTAKNSDGIAILKDFDIWAKNVSIHDMFYLLHMYKNGLPLTGGGAFSPPTDRPSQAIVANAPTVIFPGKTTTFILKADIKPNISTNLEFSSVGAFALGKTKVNAKLVGNNIVRISK